MGGARVAKDAIDDAGNLAAGSPSQIAERQQFAASARLRGATLLEIQEMMVEAGMVNGSQGGKPWGLSTISEDIKAARERWLAQATADTKEHYSRILAEIQEVKKSAWARGDLNSVLKAIGQECRIFGFNAPVKLDINVGTSDQSMKDKVLAEMSVDELRVLHKMEARMIEMSGQSRTVAADLVAS